MKQLLTSALLLIAIVASGQSNDKRLNGIEKELSKLLETWDAPGFAVAVVEKDKVVYARGFGYRDMEGKQPVTPNTLFAIGSCSKAFTSALLGQLRTETSLTFDDKPSEYIDGLSFYNDQMNDQVTVRDLMCHRTGLPRHDYSWYFFPTDNRDSLIRRVKHHEPTFGIREQWQYNNFMFLAQGMIAESLTGKSWEENIRERFFAPLGMERSTLTIGEMTRDSDRAVGYETTPDGEIRAMDYYHIRAMAPAGSINSSVSEMAHWVMAWINNGKYKGTEVIPPDYLKEAISSQMIVSGGLPDPEIPDAHMSTYGLGWFLGSYRGHYRVEHGGNINGFSASTSFFPTDSIGIIVLANQNGSVIPSVARNILADRMLGLDRISWSDKVKEQRDKQLEAQKEAISSMRSNQKENTSPSHRWEDYAGVFENAAAGRLRVSQKGDSLILHSGYADFWLKHYHHDVFEPFMMGQYGIDTTGSMLRVVFYSDASGDITSLTLNMEQGIDPVEFSRGIEEIEKSASELEIYEGDYELSGVTAKFYIKEDRLRLMVPNQPEYELVPTGEHAFSIKNLQGFNVRFTEKDGQITEAIFDQPNGIFTAVRKE